MKQTMNEMKPSGWQRRDNPVSDQPVHYPIWFHPGTDGRGLVRHHGNGKRSLGCSIYSVLLSAPVSHLLFRRRMGGPVQQKTADRRSRCPYGAGYSGHAACSPAHHLQTAFSWRASFNVCHPFPWSRHTDPCCQCSHSSAGTRGAPDALQRNQCSHAVCGTVCRSCCRRSHLCSQHPGYNPDDRYCDCHFGNRPFILPVHSLL